MFLRTMLSGPRVCFAPEDDDGLEFDPADIDPVEPDEPEDDLPEDDDPEPEAALEDEDDDLEPAPAARPQVSRATARVQKEIEVRKAAERRAEALERELAEARNARTQQQSAAQHAAEQERLAMMEPWERAEYRAQQAEARMTAELQRIRFESQDASDRVAFESLCARTPAAAAVKDEVDAALAQMRANGTTAPRETVLKYILGEKLLARQPRAKAKAERSAAGARERQAARPTSGRGDVAGGDTRRGKDDAAAREKRLSDLII